MFEKVGGIVHQAEDEIAACAFAIGASYAGKCAVTITSGPGYSLKQEGDRACGDGARFRWSSSTSSAAAPAPGQPTKVEQGDLLDRDLRQPRRRAQGRDGAVHASRTASIR